ncbi:MAG: sulfite exporter TauE/SafE family protein [Nitrospirae bacterium]|nr:sulfite exporter TauE/SafE family protein [Nitrospirota bacterium]
MDLFYVLFPISGVKTYIFIPPLVAFLCTFLTGMGGITGALLLLPFQLSVLNYVSPSVSATNLLFNIISIPSGLYRFIKEGRMVWPLTFVVLLGSPVGTFIGYLVRVKYLLSPDIFKLFVGFFLLYAGIQILQDLLGKGRTKNAAAKALDEKFRTRAARLRAQQNTLIVSGLPLNAVTRTISSRLMKIEYEFWDEKFSFNPLVVFVLSLVCGIIGGIYGMGGGVIFVSFCLAFFQLPVYTIAGSSLALIYSNSITGVAYYTFISHPSGLQTSPDWLLGLLFGAGGVLGMYLGARFQKFLPQRFIKALVGILTAAIALQYIVRYILKHLL